MNDRDQGPGWDMQEGVAQKQLEELERMNRKEIFEKLKQIDVGPHLEKKGQFNYLKWSFALETLYSEFAISDWGIYTFPDPANPEIQYPWFRCDDGTYMVKTWVRIEGNTRSCWLPVINYNNKPIENPNAMDFNTAHMRCFVKNMAYWGLGLYVYQGLEANPNLPEYAPEQLQEYSDLIENKDGFGLAAFEQCTNSDALEAVREAYMEPHVEQRTVTKTKETIRKLTAAGHEIADQWAETLTGFAETGDVDGINETIEDFSESQKKLVWVRLSASIKQAIQQLMQE